FEVVAPTKAAAAAAAVGSENRRATRSSSKPQGEANPSTNTPGIEQATDALLKSIGTMFVLRERSFMTAFDELFGEYTGCKLGSNLLESLRKTAREEIDGWHKNSKYSWTAILQHPMIRRLFPNDAEPAPLIQMNPEGKYDIEPVPLQIQSRNIIFHQEKGEETVEISKEGSIKADRPEGKTAKLTKVEFDFRLSNARVMFSAS
ncbi:hypothetical protein HDU96_004098, partial [Phlyctochytrium bullatum]